MNHNKKCSKCVVVKPITSFYSNKTKMDGVSNWCKGCVLEHYRIKRLTPQVVKDVPKMEEVGDDYLEKWWEGCKKFYQSKTNNMEVLTTNEVELLKKAHSRLHNQLQNLINDFEKYRVTTQTQIQDLKTFINELRPTGEEEQLPERLKHNTEYIGEVSEVCFAEGVKWNNTDYTNWELKLKGKDEKFYAFCPSTNIVEVGSEVRFTYNHPVQLKKLRVINNK